MIVRILEIKENEMNVSEKLSKNGVLLQQIKEFD